MDIPHYCWSGKFYLFIIQSWPYLVPNLYIIQITIQIFDAILLQMRRSDVLIVLVIDIVYFGRYPNTLAAVGYSK